MAHTHLYPRRPAVGESVSLPAQKRRKLSHSPERDDSQRSVLVGSPLRQETSGESGSSDQTASKWFDRVNEHVKQNARDTMQFDGKQLLT